ncbi:MAG TPA: hypothetical protein VFB63_19820 [Bryobacteraceae bacterium]|nr:hypothetical protein [Bryobacteraceae bacterium]
MTDHDTEVAKDQTKRSELQPGQREELYREFFEPTWNRAKVNPLDLRQPSLLRWVPTRASQNTE